jgi:hypothetical protein
MIYTRTLIGKSEGKGTLPKPKCKRKNNETNLSGKKSVGRSDIDLSC